MAGESYLLVFIRTSRMRCWPINSPVSPQDKFRRNAYIHPCLEQGSKTRSHEVAKVPVRAWHRTLQLQVLCCLICFRDNFYFPNVLCFSHSSFIVYCPLYSSRRALKGRTLSLFSFSIFVLLINGAVHIFSNFFIFFQGKSCYMQIFEINSFSYEKFS